MSFAKRWGIETPFQRLCMRINCFNSSSSSAAEDGGKAAGLLATLHGGPQGQRVKSLLPENARANGWDWTRAQEVLAAGDVDGDGRDEVVLRDARGLASRAWDSRWLRWSLPLGPSGDGRSVAGVAPVSADLDGDGVRELLAHEVAP